MTDAPRNDETDRGEDTALKRSRMAQWGSLLALAVSAMALAVGSYQTLLMQRQTRLMQVQARASVWPRVDIGYNYDNGTNADFDLHLENNGVGPAIVRSVRLSLDGKPMHHWSEVIAGIATKGGTAHAELSGIADIVIPPSTNRDTLVRALSIHDPELARKLFGALKRLDMHVCYCSVYDECWVARLDSSKPRKVAMCKASKDEFNY